MEKRNYVVAIDLGSSNVAIAVGEKSPSGLRIAALTSKPCQGVNAGQIENIALVAEAIEAAKRDIQQQLGIRITEAYAGISGQYVRCASHKDYVFAGDKLTGISQADVDHLFDRMRNVQAPGDEVILERIPQNYVIDTNAEVENPVGSFSGKLSSTFNFIICAQTPMQRLDLALRQCGIQRKDIFANVQMASESVLNSDDKEEGVVVVNIGGGVTDVAIYYRKVLRYVVTIPIGGSAINRDIRSQSILEKYVEPLKCNYGSAVAELAPNTLIQIPGRVPRETRDFPRRNLATIIEARMMDIVDYVRQEIKNSGYQQKLGYGMVLTGGTALLKDIDKLFQKATGMDVRIGLPIEGVSEESIDLVSSPQWATVVGLLLRGLERGTCLTPIDEEWLRLKQEEERRILEEEQARIAREAEEQRLKEQYAAEQEAIRQNMERLKQDMQELEKRAATPAQQPVKPAEPVKPVTPVQPVQPAQPVKPLQPAQPKPIEPVIPITPAKVEQKPTVEQPKQAIEQPNDRGNNSGGSIKGDEIQNSTKKRNFWTKFTDTMSKFGDSLSNTKDDGDIEI